MEENKHIWRKARKKPIVVEFREVNGEEQIETREGILTARQEEDYIIRGVDGEIYPIKKSIFYRTYEVIEEKDMNELKPLDLDSETKIPDNELAQSCFEMILRALISDEKEFDTKEEALDCIFSLLDEFKDEIKNQIKSACKFYLKYKDDPELLIKDYPEYKKEMEERNKEFLSVIENLKQSLIPDVVKGLALSLKDKEYNDWLFKLAFKSVLDEELKLYNE